MLSRVNVKKPCYNSVEEPASGARHCSETPGQKIRSISFYLVTAIITVLLIAGSFVQLNLSIRSTCESPPVRREWRSLTSDEKRNFTRSVNILAGIPSSRRSNGTIYDDFAILHGSIGSYAHRSASFLPWHRYTLIVFENTLRKHAGFTGQIPYWDWSLDWMDLANSSIWDSVHGFGGDGDPFGPETVGEGRCIVDGPFAKLRPILYNHTFTQHCISRGFHDGNQMGRLPGAAYSPEKMGEILRKPRYKDFVRELEIYLHGSLHQSVNGDFKAMTAANDPLFYVHHAQLDRVWWQWQQQDPRSRLTQYEGKHMFNSTGNATVSDMLMYGGFTDDVSVSSVMNTEGGFLCYKY
ncbi:uncharacterized protein UV8b_06024 [Ustilaginoidea virens]|nr:uncharacterized protein UV8b_06024 [Ustilaginoidea virens]QUC21780.1 hypothetical protein UV8b_06024 [Ustilaginoidea virens]